MGLLSICLHCHRNIPLGLWWASLTILYAFLVFLIILLELLIESIKTSTHLLVYNRFWTSSIARILNVRCCKMCMQIKYWSVSELPCIWLRIKCPITPAWYTHEGLSTPHLISFVPLRPWRRINYHGTSKVNQGRHKINQVVSYYHILQQTETKHVRALPKTC